MVKPVVEWSGVCQIAGFDRVRNFKLAHNWLDCRAAVERSICFRSARRREDSVRAMPNERAVFLTLEFPSQDGRSRQLALGNQSCRISVTLESWSHVAWAKPVGSQELFAQV